MARSVASWQLLQILRANLHNPFLSETPFGVAVKRTFQLEQVILNSYCEEVDITVYALFSPSDIHLKRNTKLELKAINEVAECK